MAEPVKASRSEGLRDTVLGVCESPKKKSTRACVKAVDELHAEATKGMTEEQREGFVPWFGFPVVKAYHDCYDRKVPAKQRASCMTKAARGKDLSATVAKNAKDFLAKWAERKKKD